MAGIQRGVEALRCDPKLCECDLSQDEIEDEYDDSDLADEFEPTSVTYLGTEFV